PTPAAGAGAARAGRIRFPVSTAAFRADRSLTRLSRVRHLGRQPTILDRNAHREVVQTLKGMVFEAEHVMDGVIVKAADAGRARAGRFRFQVQNLPDEAGLPEEVTVERLAVLAQARVELRNHAQAEEAVGRD